MVTEIQHKHDSNKDSVQQSELSIQIWPRCHYSASFRSIFFISQGPKYDE